MPQADNATAGTPPAIPKFCDWRIEIRDCILTEIWVTEVSISLVTNAILAFTSAIFFYYRRRYMWQGLFVDQSSGIRPLPVDCLLLFWGISTVLRALYALLLLFDAFSAYWQRELLQELGWTFLCFGAACYLIGIIYTIPVSYTRGSDAMISLGSSNKRSTNNGVSNDKSTHVIILPTPIQLNFVLGAYFLFPTLIMLPAAVLSGVARDQGNFETAAAWTTVHYVSYWVYDWSVSIISAYYGIHFMIILRTSMNNFDNRSAGGTYHQSNSPTRQAFHRLKYTMAYLFFLSFISGPGWGVYGIRYISMVTGPNLYSLFISGTWYITGPQPLIAVCQYVLAKRIYQHYIGKSKSSNNITGSSVQSTTITSRAPPAMQDGILITQEIGVEMDFALDMKSGADKTKPDKKGSQEFELMNKSDDGKSEDNV
ncbi:9650_t:CDS:2 [Paraglomus brasilianum]|uniref:9650_t:CDS:1 n=1 Tax=Paraglomus brasilianum TaxID=144538 RepID=A0A9N9BHX3_9GLOM|nr:9650_t:CDS:2 [Paraglomus brasilianum]